MDNKERIALYLSGLTDKKEERKTENALTRNASFLESFIDTVETRLHAVPFGFAAYVMQNLPSSPSAAVRVPLLSRRLCASVCFTSAAVIMLLSLSGFNRNIAEFISTQSGKLNELLTFAQNLISGGK